MTKERFGRPKSRLFAFLSVMWLGVSFLALMVVFGARSSGEPISLFVVLCGLAAVPLPIFIVLAMVFRFTEQPRFFSERVDNPDYDPHNV